MLAMTLTVTDYHLPALQAGLAKLQQNRRDFFLVWAKEVTRRAQRKALGYGGRNLWREIAQATRPEQVTDQGALVAARHVASRQKQLGGPIKAKPGKLLTIPIHELSVGVRAREFKLGGRRLFRWRSKKGNLILGYDPAAKLAKAGKKNRKPKAKKAAKPKPKKPGARSAATAARRLVALYVLKRETAPQRAFPWFPASPEIGEVGLRELRWALDSAGWS